MIRCKAGDTVKQVTLRRGAGIVDLPTGSSVAYRFKQRPGSGFATGACTIVSTSGEVQFPVPAVGRYDAEFQVTEAGQVETVPNVLYDVLIVRAVLAA